MEEEVGENTTSVLVASEKGARGQQESNCLRREGATHGPERRYFLVKIYYLAVLLSYYNGCQLN